MTAADFSVNCTSVTNSTYHRYLNVLSATQDDTDPANPIKKLRVMFGGARTGAF